MYCLCVLAIVAVVLLLPGCSGQAGEVKARLGEEFSLAIGRTALIEESSLKIKFAEVIEDSRCPEDVTCIWAGRVSCIVIITDNGHPYGMTLTEPGLTDQYAKEAYREYQLAFHVEPYPEAGKRINKDQYRLLLIVSNMQNEIRK